MAMKYIKSSSLPRVDDPILNRALEQLDGELGRIAKVFIDWTGDAGANNIHDNNILSSSITQHEDDIDHDALTNYESDEHLSALDEDNMVSNSDTNVATQQSIKAYVDSLIAGVNEFPELTDTPANYTGSAGKFVKVNATPDALEFASILWGDVSKVGSNLTDLATRQHAGLTNVTSDQHHAISHEARHRSAGADALNHDLLAGFLSGEHFLQSAITTVGTVGTGTWQGTAIANAYVAGIDQNLLQASSPTLNDLTISTPVNIYALSHNSFADFVANKHIDHTGVTLTAGSGLSGGGTIAANRTFNLGALTAAWDAGSHQIRALKFYSDQATGVAPFTVASTTKVTNLNADLWDGQHLSTYLDQAVKQASSPTFAELTVSGNAKISTYNYISNVSSLTCNVWGYSCIGKPGDQTKLISKSAAGSIYPQAIIMGGLGGGIRFLVTGSNPFGMDGDILIATYEKMKLDTSGNLWLHSATSKITGGTRLYIEAGADGVRSVTIKDDTIASGANVFISTTAEAHLYRSTSGRKYKDNIKDLELDSSLIYSLQPRSFNSLCKGDDKERRFVGLIAEEIEQYYPQIINYNEKNEAENYDNQMLLSLILAEVQKLNGRVSALEN